MTITLSPETNLPPWIEEARDWAEAIEGVQRGDRAAAAGRERPLTEFFEEQRAKYSLPASWPHVVQSSRDAA
jgi:hypothetical protein